MGKRQIGEDSLCCKVLDQSRRKDGLLCDAMSLESVRAGHSDQDLQTFLRLHQDRHFQGTERRLHVYWHYRRPSDFLLLPAATGILLLE